jgi:uncharacterized protein (TIGR02453 family)
MADLDRLPQASLTFLRDLAAHNEREWFDANRERCAAELIEPCRGLVRAISAELAVAFPQVVGSDKKNGGSLTRLHRDTRFGKDKRPYNSHVGLHFWHADGAKMQVPGFFVRIDPDEVLVATGYHGPDNPQLQQIREAIDADGDSWAAAAHDATFITAWGALEGASLKRVPKPWDAAHPYGDDLRRKDFTAFAKWKPTTATRAGFAGRLIQQWKASEALMEFLCRATDLRW